MMNGSFGIARTLARPWLWPGALGRAVYRRAMRPRLLADGTALGWFTGWSAQGEQVGDGEAPRYVEPAQQGAIGNALLAIPLVGTTILVGRILGIEGRIDTDRETVFAVWFALVWVWSFTCIVRAVLALMAIKYQRWLPDEGETMPDLSEAPSPLDPRRPQPRR